MLLALDVGNTNITAGAFKGRRLLAQWRHQTDPGAAPAALGRQLAEQARRRGVKVSACVYGSVVPAVDGVLERQVRLRFGCRARAVTPRSKLGMRLRVRKPAQVGADRVLNALAAYELAGGAAVVLDFGTATTFDCLSRRGDYLGGAILLGPLLAAQALHRRTAKLPLVPLARPRRVIGKDTAECIQAGLYFGYLGMIEKVLGLTLAEMRSAEGESRPRLFATGGLAGVFAEDLPRRMRIVPDLTLQGLRIAHERLSVAGEWE